VLYLARYALILLAVIVLAVYLPMLFDMSFGERRPKTHLFYSPLCKKFIWRDKLLRPAEESQEKVHHAQFVQMDQDGKRYTRQEFEKPLPFIYYKNMELWGLLPLKIDGESFDKESIRADRQVVELKPKQIAWRSPDEQVYPLLESQPDAARLAFPEDRFRLAGGLEFINADFNRPDQELSRKFNQALKEAGVAFPLRLAAGNHTILKSFDDGFFLLDASGAVFHLKRVKGEPWVLKTPIDPALGVRSIKVSENSRKEFHALLLTNDDRLFLLSYDNYRLIPLPLEEYVPDSMDFKLIINPLYRTAVYSDDKIIRAVVLDKDYRPLTRYQHTMPGAELTRAQSVFSYLAPFRLDMEDPNSGYFAFQLKFWGAHSLIALSWAMALFLVYALRRRGGGKGIWADGLVVLLTGAYGLIAVTMPPLEE